MNYRDDIVSYPVVDLFAGPGGLGEGFSQLYNSNYSEFTPIASIEDEFHAYQTLVLRHFFRSFRSNSAPDDYYLYLEKKIPLDELIKRNLETWSQASNCVWNISLGKSSRKVVCNSLKNVLNQTQKWVLIGGPPCQAYSLIGRSRMKNKLDFENDDRHYLYKEYLYVLARLKPPVFLMENVKGLLSARIGNRQIFNQILHDLTYLSGTEAQKRNFPHYRLYSLSENQEYKTSPKQFIVKAEDYGVPQTRHRIFILGIRTDVEIAPSTLRPQKAPIVNEIIGNLPKIRSGISRNPESIVEWKQAIASAETSNWLLSDNYSQNSTIKRIADAIQAIKNSNFDRSSTEYRSTNVMNGWFIDERLKILTLHEARSHMKSDLHRYLYASSYAATVGVSPKLADFPPDLLPLHKNVDREADSFVFPDRFRVQIGSRFSSTITSHISKDGHYFIHHEPDQCRSLTVREAARLQTFPDNYYFVGPRTSQYHQVGNAVPPYLAVQIANIVKKVLDDMPNKQCDN